MTSTRPSRTSTGKVGSAAVAGGVSAAPSRRARTAHRAVALYAVVLDVSAGHGLLRMGAGVVHGEDLVADTGDADHHLVDLGRDGLSIGEVADGADVDRGAQRTLASTARSSSPRSSVNSICSSTSCRKPVTMSCLAASSGTPRERR